MRGLRIWSVSLGCRKDDGAVGAVAAHIDDALGCGELGVLGRTNQFLDTWFGKSKPQESAFVHVGMEMSPEKDYSARLTQAGVTSKLAPTETPSAPWAAGQELLPPGDVPRCQCELEKLCWLASLPTRYMCTPCPTCIQGELAAGE